MVNGLLSCLHSGAGTGVFSGVEVAVPQGEVTAGDLESYAVA